MHLDGEEELWLETAGDDIESSGGERLKFQSVGIDIGSSTSHLMFSRLVLARRGREYFSGYTVVERQVTYRSPVILTPFSPDNSLVDAGELRAFIDRAYADAGLTPAEVDTGAVITTGEAARKENTAAIISLLAEERGKFVCAAAGPNLEAVLAAHGSGAVKHSLRHRDGRHETVMNIDVGGGTAKIAVVAEGRVLATCAVNVGSRLVAWDAGGVLTRVEEAGSRVAGSIGIKAEVGKRLDLREKEQLAGRLADLLFEVLGHKPMSPLARSLMITPAVSFPDIDTVVYSGGVAEFIYGREERDFGDLGPWLGRAVRARQRRWEVALAVPLEYIRATVIGASQYTVQVSGNTIFLSHPELLPLRNLPAVKIPPLPGRFDRRAVAEAIEQGYRMLDLQEGNEKAALVFSWNHDPDYTRLNELAAGIKLSLPRTLASGLPVVLIFDNDVGKLVGHLLEEAGVNPVVSIDSISVRELSYVDIGGQLSAARAVPVTVKSLVFT